MIMKIVRCAVCFLSFVLTSQMAYARSFEPEKENVKLKRGDWSILKKIPTPTGSLYEFMKANRLKVSKTSEDVYCIDKMFSRQNQPEGCYVGFRVQRVGHKDEYCSPRVGCAPCGLSMIYYRRTDQESFIPFSPQARALASGATERFFVFLDDEDRNYCNTP